MRAEHHYDDESLIALLEAGDDHAIARDPHLAACSSCSEVATSLRQIAGALEHDDVWETRELDETPNPNTITTLRAFSDEMTREDAFAATHLPTLLAGPRETWMANLQAHPEYRTAGMVRALIAATDRALDTMPPDAVAMIAVATDIADHLLTSAYATDTVLKLRGAAWRERAYALFYVGSYTDADAAICASESHFSHCVVNEYDLGRDDIVHALVHRALDRDETAIAAAGSAVSRLRDCGDVERYVSAVMAQAQTKIKVLDYAGALNLLIPLRQACSRHISPDAHARLLGNMGVCQRAVRDFDGAAQSYRSAAVIFETLGIITEAARTRAQVSVCLRETGDIAAAAIEMQQARAAFERLGMGFDVALSGLALAEIALSQGDYALVEVLCRSSMAFFETAGVPYGPRAMTALAYLTEASRERRVTPALVRNVQRYIRRLPSQPTLLFAPLPD